MRVRISKRLQEQDRFVRALLADGPVASAEAYEAAEASGFSKQQFRTAAARVGAVSRKQRGGFGLGWEWVLEDEETEDEALARIFRR